MKFDGVLAVAPMCGGPRGVVGHPVDLLRLVFEKKCVLEEVDVGAHVRHHQLLVDRELPSSR